MSHKKSQKDFSESANSAIDKAGKAGGKAADSVSNNIHAGHVILGMGLGSLAGHMDLQYIEPFGVIIGGSLLAVQFLDHKEYCKMTWNEDVPKSRFTSRKGGSSVGEVAHDVMEFATNNASMAVAFAGGYTLIQYLEQ